MAALFSGAEEVKVQPICKDVGWRVNAALLAEVVRSGPESSLVGRHRNGAGTIFRRMSR